MLSLPSINTTSPPVLVSRPALVSDAVRSSAGPAPAIEPTSAISKQRSKVNSKVDQQPAETGQQVQSGQIASTQAGVYPTKKIRVGQPTDGRDSPPSEKTSVQKALEAQLKELLSKVWDASGKAVDFLLGRDESLLEKTLKNVQLPVDVDYLTRAQASGSSKQPSADMKPINVRIDSYNASGSASGTESRGRLLDMVA